MLLYNEEFVGEIAFLENAVVIGEDGGGNPYVLTTAPGKEGVYYWDRTHLHEGDPINNFDIAEGAGCGNLFLVVGSFEEFYDLIVKSLGGSLDYEQA